MPEFMYMMMKFLPLLVLIGLVLFVRLVVLSKEYDAIDEYEKKEMDRLSKEHQEALEAEHKKKDRYGDW